MIVVDEKKELVKLSVFGELTLADFREFENAVRAELKGRRRIGLLFDLTGMTGYTIDVAWEELKFSRAHTHDFRRIAVVAPGQWVPWLSWVSAAFTDAEVQIFEDPAAAGAWLSARR